MLHPHVFQPGTKIVKHIIFSMDRNTQEGTKITIFIIFICFYMYMLWSNFIFCFKSHIFSGFLNISTSNKYNHNYNKIVKSDWLSTALISALIGQFNRTVRVMPK